MKFDGLTLTRNQLSVNTINPQTTRRFMPVHKENKHESGRSKKSAEAQET